MEKIKPDTKIVCPKCHSTTSLRKIFYGMPDGEIDESIYSYGGCCLSELNPTKNCINCGWQGEYVSVETLMSME